MFLTLATAGFPSLFWVMVFLWRAAAERGGGEVEPSMGYECGQGAGWKGSRGTRLAPGSCAIHTHIIVTKAPPLGQARIRKAGAARNQ